MIQRIIFWGAELLLVAFGLVFRLILLPFSFLGQVCFFLALLLGAYEILRVLARWVPKPAWIARQVLTGCICIGFVLFAVTEAFVIHASFGQKEKSCQYVVVLGCLVRENGPSVSLRNRIDAAYGYLTEHPEAIAIVSGGQGSDEPMSEAQCMYNELVARGIDPTRVWMEDRATSTWTNLQYSAALIEEKTGSRPQTVGILSSEYHLLRAGLQAKDLGLDPVGIPAKTTNPMDALNHFLREVAGIWHYILLGGQYD